MSDDDPHTPLTPPAWIALALWQTLLAAREASLASGRDPTEALEAARTAVLAVWPSLPPSHLSEVLAILARRVSPSESEQVSAGGSEGTKPVPREDVALDFISPAQFEKLATS
jgi:hypothetical protein